MTGEVFDPMAIVDAFNRHQVDYVVIGGFAAELHEAAVRPTRDIDFTPSATLDNLERVSRALTDLGARLRTDAVPGVCRSPATVRRSGGRPCGTLTCERGEFDITFVPDGTDGYDDLVRSARPGHAGRLAQRRSAIEGGRPGRVKDIEALPAIQDRVTAEQGTPEDQLSAALGRRAVERSEATVDAPPPNPPRAGRPPLQRASDDPARQVPPHRQRRREPPRREFGR